MPAATMARRVTMSSDAGPTVATILVRRSTRVRLGRRAALSDARPEPEGPDGDSHGLVLTSVTGSSLADVGRGSNGCPPGGTHGCDVRTRGMPLRGPGGRVLQRLLPEARDPGGPPGPRVRLRARRLPVTTMRSDPMTLIGPGVVQIDTLLGGWERVTAGYLIEGPEPVLVETGSQTSVPSLLAALADHGPGTVRPGRRGRHPHPPRPRRRGGRRGRRLPPGHGLRAREGGPPPGRPVPAGGLRGPGLRRPARLPLRPAGAHAGRRGSRCLGTATRWWSDRVAP